MKVRDTQHGVLFIPGDDDTVQVPIGVELIGQTKTHQYLVIGTEHDGVHIRVSRMGQAVRAEEFANPPRNTVEFGGAS